MSSIVISGTRREPQAVVFPEDNPALESDLVSRYKAVPCTRGGRKALLARGLPLNIFSRVSSWSVARASADQFKGLTDPRTLLIPLVTRVPGSGSLDEVAVWPRLREFSWVKTKCIPGVEWQKDGRHFTAPLLCIMSRGGLRQGAICDDVGLVAEAIRRLDAPLNPLSPLIATVGGLLSPSENQEAYDLLCKWTGGLPEWFGVELLDYQKTGCLAVAAGHTLLADEPGLGKTFQSLAAASILGAQRLLVASPTVVVSHWELEILSTGMVRNLMGARDEDEECERIATLVSGRKERDLPDKGVVVTTPSLMRARPELRAAVEAWRPDVFILDEAHVAKSWTSGVSAAMRGLARASAKTIAITGTPVSKEPSELAALMSITGHLDPVFGGAGDFLDNYTVPSPFGSPMPRKRALPQLERITRGNVMVRRTRASALPQLPVKERSVIWADVDLSGYHAAYADLLESIRKKIRAAAEKNGGNEPSAAELDPDVVADSMGIGLVSPLREAAGIAKLPIAKDMICRWGRYQKEAHPAGGFEDPLIVWVHHKSVMEGLAQALNDADIPFERITGGMTTSKIGRIRNRFQAGEFAVLLCVIRAAGVGITLTRARNVLFVEGDWTNALMSQAESRAHRIGQDNRVHVRSLVARGTLDLAMQSVLLSKTEVLDVLTPGSDVNTAVVTREDIERFSDMGAPVSTKEVVRFVVRMAVAGMGETVGEMNARCSAYA